MVVNASGPWVDNSLNLISSKLDRRYKIQMVKGSHIIVPKLYNDEFSYIFQNKDNRIIQAWMYVTPVIYPLSQIPEQWRWAINMNPMTTIVESYRLLFLGAGTVNFALIVQSIGLSIFFLLSGLLIYNRIQRNFVDYS